MNIRSKNILLISPEPWNHIFVSKHHYATHLATRGNRVFFLDPPNNEDCLENTEFENLFAVKYTGFIKGLRFLPVAIQNYFIKRKFRQLETLCGIKFDIIWSFDNSVFYDFSVLPKEVFSISHIVDLNQDFEFEKAAKTADLCLGVCQPVLEKLKKSNQNSFFINHGFNEKEKCENSLSIRLPGKNKIKAFYAGNLDIQYIDWTLIHDCIEKFKDVDFIFAGPWKDSEIKQRLSRKSNFNYMGILKASELGEYYENSDILLIAYKYSEFPDQLSNSHKMMEYLGSGKVIVATWTEEYVSLLGRGLIKMAKNQKEFISEFSQVEENLEYWNNDEKKSLRSEFASQNTYENQINRIEKIIKSHS